MRYIPSMYSNIHSICMVYMLSIRPIDMYVGIMESQSCSDLLLRLSGERRTRVRVPEGQAECAKPGTSRAPILSIPLLRILSFQVRNCLGKPPTPSLLSSLIIHSSPKEQATFPSWRREIFPRFSSPVFLWDKTSYIHSRFNFFPPIQFLLILQVIIKLLDPLLYRSLPRNSSIQPPLSFFKFLFFYSVF